MKNVIGGMILFSSIFIAGCDSDSTSEPLTPSKASITRPIFQPAQGRLPIPNDILFSDTLDLTLNIPVADETDLSNPTVQLNTIDGWSTISPIVISFETDTSGLSLNPDSIIGGETVRIFRVVTAYDAYAGGSPLIDQSLAVALDDSGTPLISPLTGGEIPLPSTVPVQVAAELVPDVDYTIQFSSIDPRNLTLEILPLRPLATRAENGAGASYVLVLTNGMEDTSGTGVVADGQYDVARTGNLPENATDALIGLSALVRTIESAVSTHVDPESIVLSLQFTTQGSGIVLDAVKDTVLAQIPAIPSSGFTAVAPVCNILGNCDAITAGGLNDAVAYQGQLTLPYYLEAWQGDAATITGPMEGFWEAPPTVNVPTGDPDNPMVAVDNPLGTNLSYANKVPEIKSWETIPVLVTVPSVAPPTDGFPVVIFQHGITADRSNALAIAQTFANAGTGYAVVAIDLPLHGIPAVQENDLRDATSQALAGLLSVNGTYVPSEYVPGSILAPSLVRERTFQVDYISNTDATSRAPDGIPDTSGAHFINLASLLTSRDNLRQAVADLFSVYKALPTMDVNNDGTLGDLNAANVSFIGHSLGGIVGGAFGALQTELQAVALVNASGGIARLVQESPTLGPSVLGGLASVGVVQGTSDFESYMLALQSALDSVDPINFGDEYIVAPERPILLTQVVGDSVVINQSANFPLSGTEALARSYGLEKVTAPILSPQVVRGFLSYSEGVHSSFLNPAVSADVTTVMQQTVAGFIASGGMTLPFDPSLFIDTEAQAIWYSPLSPF
ncbi:MAG: hypothetical protein AAGB12_14655 [Pseudomonadota bacterium]